MLFVGFCGEDVFDGSMMFVDCDLVSVFGDVFGWCGGVLVVCYDC